MYVAFDEAAFEQHVPVICSTCAAGEHGEACVGEIDDQGENTCDCVEGACRGEWVEIGATVPTTEIREASEPLFTVPVEEVRRTVEAIEVLASVPEEHRETITRGALTGVHIAQARPVFAPTAFSIPGRIGADGKLVLGEPAPVEEDDEPPRYRLNRADRRRLARGRRRRG